VSSTVVDAGAYRTNLVRSVPLVLAVPVAIGTALVLAGVPLDPVALGAGAAGWLIALALRAPVALVAMRLGGGDRGRAQPVITGASGPLEELVRLAVVLIVGRELPAALWIGLGWGAIEAVYALVNGAAVLALLRRTDPEAEQARAMLAMPDVLRPDAPLWGAVERTWATGLHMAFTLIVAAVPVLVVATIVVHSAANLVLLRRAPAWGLARLQAAGIALTAVMLLVALTLWIGG
jgi:hypothetical protein